jgi:N-formylglutamate amidohydrolase
MPHAGVDIPAPFRQGLASQWLAQRDADWWIDKLYDFGAPLGATLVRTSISRTVIDVNRDPAGASLYPGQATTELCPTTTFDGEPLYRSNAAPDAAAIEKRREIYYVPYHAALVSEIKRLRARYARIVLYDCHSIRSRIPRLFAGECQSGDPPRQKLRGGFNEGTPERLQRDTLFPCDRRTLQGRLHYAPLRPARRRRACHPDGIGLPRVYA